MKIVFYTLGCKVTSVRMEQLGQSYQGKLGSAGYE